MRQWVVIFVALMGLDLCTTFYGFSLGAQESNPLWPVWAMPLVKVIATALIVALLWLLRRLLPTWSKPAAIGACIIMAGVVLNNLIVLALMQGGMKA